MIRDDIKKSFLTTQGKTPASLDTPAYLMNFPFTVSSSSPNNPLMSGKPYNHKRANSQFMKLYNAIAKEALVYILPSEDDYQDLPFVANIGCYLPHLKNPTILVANFKSPPRQGEDIIGKKFFRSMNYKVDQPPNYWEGEADLKYIKDNLFIAGYGIRSELKAYNWMKDKYGMDIVTIKMEDPKLYHFDCLFFPLTATKALVTTSVVSKDDIKRIEKHVEIVNVPKEYNHDGWTNRIRLRNKILYNKMNTGSDRAFEALMGKHSFSAVGFDLDEFDKSGADLSCMIMHLNVAGRE